MLFDTPNSSLSSMKIMFLLSLLFSVSAHAVMDSELNQYIKDFQMGSLGSPSRPVKPELYRAGELFFFGKILSGKNNITCGHCHQLQNHSGDALPLALGEGAVMKEKTLVQSNGKILKRHTPALFNLGLPGINSFFWDGRVSRDFANNWYTPEPSINGEHPSDEQLARTFDSLLSVQAVFPIATPDEMLGKDSKLSIREAWDSTMKRVNASETYTKNLRLAYPGVETFTIAHVGNAIAEYERYKFLANQTPWDKYIRGDNSIMNERMIRGAKVFIVRADCRFCHVSRHLSSFGGQNIAIPQIRQEDVGMQEFNDSPLAPFAFRIPPLRNVGVTAPYMHNGVFKNLKEVINHYDEPLKHFENFTWDPVNPAYNEKLPLLNSFDRMKNVMAHFTGGLSAKIGLSEEQKEDLRCFLQVALTDVAYQKYLVDDIPNCSPIR